MCDFAKRQAPTIAKAMRNKRLQKDKAALRRRRSDRSARRPLRHEMLGASDDRLPSCEPGPRRRLLREGGYFRRRRC